MARARKIQRFLSQPFFVAEVFTGIEGRFVPVAETVESFEALVNGDLDEVPEQAFLNVGGVDSVLEKARYASEGRLNRFMAATQFELVTPSQTLYSGQAEMIVCRTVDGEIAFLANHMPYIGALDTCVVRVVGPGSEDSETSGEPDVRVAVLSGFVEVKDNQVIMLADVAELASEVDWSRLAGTLTAATERVSASGEDTDAAAQAEADLRWAQVRVEVVEPA